MKNWRRLLKTAGALFLAAVVAAAVPAVSYAWDLDGESTQVNDIKTNNPSSLITTIQTNYHAFGITGFVVLTPSKTIDSLLGITTEMQFKEARGVMYVANTTCGEKAEAAMKAEAGKVNGEILWYFDLQLFKFDGSWYEPITSLTSPIKMALGIGESDRSDDYDYAMIRLHDGKTTLLTDLDDDAYTVTFESDQFSTYALIRYPKGTKVSGNTTPASNTQKPSSGSDLDDVPKTGDDLWRNGMLLVMAGCVCLVTASTVMRRKEK